MWVGAISVFMVLSFSGMVEDVFAQNIPPVADAGPDQIVASGATVTLDGSGSSDSDGTITIYTWQAQYNPSFTISITNPQIVNPTFVAPTGPATVVIGLVVIDDQSSISASDTVTITVLPPPLPPIADAGPPQTVRYGDTVTLDGRGSTDPNGDQITYSWAHTSGLSASLTGSNTAQPTFTAPSSTGTITFTLTVTAGTDSDTDDVTINVTAPTQNQPPTANAGRDRTFAPGSIVTLNGSGSDPDGNDADLKYTWDQTSGTPKVTINDKMSARTTFTAPPDPTELVFTLTVDDRTDTTTDDITITIAKPITRNIKEMSDTLLSAKITAPNEITMTYNEELSTFINSYLNFTITGESIPRSITGINGSPSIDTGKTIFVDGERVKTYSTTLIFDGEPVSSNSTGSMYMQHADHYLAFIHVNDGQN